MEDKDSIICVVDNFEFVLDDNDNDTTSTIVVEATFNSFKTTQMIDDDQFIDSLMNIKAGYNQSKTVELIGDEENVHNTTKYLHEMKRMMTVVKKQETFEVNYNDESETQYVFIQVLRYIIKNTSTTPKTVVLGYTLDGI